MSGLTVTSSSMDSVFISYPLCVPNGQSVNLNTGRAQEVRTPDPLFTKHSP